ncbi:MAG: hypothetical protein WC378_17880 [Opitutaceae bacterium]|jgi:hypothetical protein
MPRRRVHILQMGKHFLYLPLYFARQNQFFGFLPDDVHVEIDTCEAGSDEATYSQIMDETAAHRDFVMAVTDPIQVFKTPLDARRKPAVLATLVTNGAFWAVNHGTRKINGLRDLGAFERVIAYRPGTSSYSIAARIARESGNTTPLDQFIEVVAPGKELLLLTDAKKGHGAVALSPDLLTIEDMTHNQRASVELALGGTPEYNDVLVTALVSYQQYVKDNRTIVDAIVMGLQKALLMTRLKHPDVIKFAEDYFTFGEHASGAVSKALQAEVFPLSVSVAQAHWMHAAKAYFEANHPGGGWTRDEEERGIEYFKAFVEPYSGIGEHATKRLLDAAPQPKPDGDDPRRLLTLLVCAFMAVGLAVGLGLVAALCLVGGSFMTWWFARQKWVTDYRLIFWLFIVGAVSGTLLVALPYVGWLHVADKADPRNVGLGFITFALGTALAGYAMRPKP